MAVDLGKPRQPGLGPGLLPLELGMPLLQPRDVRTQRVEQPRGVLARAERSGGSASVSAPRSLMCRSHTHDNNMIQIVPFLFHRLCTESSGTESQAGAGLRGKLQGRISSLPKLRPSSRPRKAGTVLSIPSTTSSRYLT